MPEPPCVSSAHQNSPIGYPQHVGASLVCDALITHANPGNPQNVSNSAVPELVNEMARSLGEGPVLASIKQRGADANKEKSPFDVPWHLARKPYRLQTSMYLRGFCNAPGNIFKNTKTKTIAHDTAKIEEFMHMLHFFCSNENLR